MNTTKINVKAHIAEYCYGKYSSDGKSPVRFPHQTEIYHTVWDLLQVRPVNARPDNGNLEIRLPNSKMKADNDCGDGFVKNPATYNYLSARSQQIIQRKIETFMFAEIHDLLFLNRKAYGMPYIDTVHCFMLKYGIMSVTEDMFIKDFYRWRKVVYQRKLVRNYTIKS